MNKKRVGILFGGMSCEHEVSLLSATSVLENIDREKYEPVPIGITKDGKWYLYEGDISLIKDGSWEKCENAELLLTPSNGAPIYVKRADSIFAISIDTIFPALHGFGGEDGRLQGLLESAGIPFVGPGSLSSAVCMDKAMTKLVLKNYEIPQAKAILVTKREFMGGFDKIEGAAALLSYPLFVKPSAAGSSVGVSKAENPEELKKAIEGALAVGDRVLVEEYVEGAEIEVAVLGGDDLTVSVCGEIAPGSDFYDYDTKYKNDTAKYYIPARLDESVSEKIREYASRIFRALDCKGLSRVDFFVKGDRIIFNEINTLPGFTSISMYPKLLMASGMSYPDIISNLIELSLEK